MRKAKTKKSKGEFLFEISDISTPNTKVEFYVLGYSKPDHSLYVNGVWISRKHMKRMAMAMLECLEFSK